MKKPLILVLAAIMAVSMIPGLAFAGEASDSTDAAVKASAVTQEKEDEDSTAGTQQLEEKELVSAAVDGISQNKAVYDIGYVEMTSGVEKDFENKVGIVSYGASGGYNAVNGYYKGFSKQVTVKAKGTIMMSVSGESNSSSGYIYFGVFKDSNMTQPVNGTRGVSAGSSKPGAGVFSIPDKGTYYVGVYSYISSDQKYNVVSLAAYANGADRTLSNGKWSTVGQKEEQTNLFKFKASSTGYIRVDAESDYRVTVTLLSSSKKALSSAASNYYTPVYGVRKGATYYIRVKSGYNSGGGYNIKVTNSKISEKSGSSKSKAVNIKRKATVKGTVTAGESRSDWYKLKLSGKKNVTLTVKGATNDRLKVEIYSGKKKIKTSTFYNSTKSLTLKSVGKWKKGTYHIKVSRGNSKSSGWYSLNWK